MSMSDYDPDDDGQESAPRNFRRQLEADKRAAEDERDALKAQLAEIERSNVFAQAGVPAGSFFAKGYDGEMTVDAVSAAYQREMGRTEEAAIQASLAGHEQAQRLAAGSTPPSASTKDADWAAVNASVRSKRRNAQGFGGDRIELERLSARDIDEVNTSIWHHPRQLAQRT